MAVGEIVGSLIDGMSSAFNNAMSYQYSKKLMNYQSKLNYKYAQKNAENSPLWQRKGLETAGYNPMLAIQNGLSATNSSWSNNSQFQNQGTSVNALETANAISQNRLTKAQEENTNADTVLKNHQSITELYTQLEKLNHADLMSAQKILADKDISWYDKKQAREDLKVATDIERMGNDFKVGMANAIANQVSANASMRSAIANEQDVRNRYDLGKNTGSESRDMNIFGIGGKWTSSGYKKDGLSR